ncbi:MAG: hypothetical protein QXZ41_01695 [Ignisphaera sp.]
MIVYIGIAAYSRKPSSDTVEKVSKFIDKLKDSCEKAVEEIVFVVGGYEGLMKIFVDKALENGFNLVILPPLEQENQEFPEKAVVIKTGTTFIIRSSILVHTSDALVAIGGGVGSLEEILTAHNEGKQVYVLVDTGLPTDIVKMLPSKLDERVEKH